MTYTCGAEITNEAHIALINPIRYRGYYYDNETRLYYLESRYYDPELCRFISADNQIAGVSEDTLGYNLFAYCFNDPVNNVDPTGDWPSLGDVFKVVVGITMVVAAVATVVAAAPVAMAAVSIGYTAATVTAVGTVACASVAAVCGASIVGEAVTGSNPVKKAIGEEVFDVVSTVATAGMIQGSAGLSGLSGQPQLPAKPKPSVSNPGVPFESGKTGVQYGVDPNTLIPVKKLSTLDPQRMANAVKYGGDHAVIVSKVGIIQDGHHRVADAINNGRAVDIIVEPYK